MKNSSNYYAQRLFIVLHGLELGLETDELVSKISSNGIFVPLINILVIWHGSGDGLIELFEIHDTHIGERKSITTYKNHRLLADSQSFDFKKHSLTIAIFNDTSHIAFLTNIFETLSTKLNFTLDLKYIDLAVVRTRPHLNIDLLRNRSIHCSPNLCHTFSGVSSFPYSIIELVTVFKPRRSFNFDDSLLLYIHVNRNCIIYLTICNVLICFVLVMKSPRLMRDITKVFLEVHGVFYGYPLTFPTRVKALIITFGILNLFIRTDYQAANFKALTLNLFDDSPSSLKDLQVGDFKVIAPNAGFDSKVFRKSLPSGLQGIGSSKTQQELLNIINQLPYDTGFFAEKYTVYFQKLIDPHIQIISQPIYNVNRCLYFQENHPLKEVFKHYIDMLKEGGFIDKWSSVDIERVKFKIHKEPVQITVKDILIVFILIGSGLTTSFLFFFLEILFFRFAYKK